MSRFDKLKALSLLMDHGSSGRIALPKSLTGPIYVALTCSAWFSTRLGDRTTRSLIGSFICRGLSEYLEFIELHLALN
jgi:hypothetical protein